MRCKHPFKKSISSACWPIFTFQFRDPPFRPALFPVAGKGVAWPLPELPPPAMQYVGVNLQRPRHFADRDSLLQPPYRGQLELLGELPARQPHDSILL